jgi:hypothetical protein
MNMRHIPRLVPIVVGVLALAAGLSGAIRPAAAVYGPPDLQVGLIASPNPVAPNGTITAKLVVSNSSEEHCRWYGGEDHCYSTGKSVSGVVVELTKPAGAIVFSMSDNHGFNCADHPGVVRCDSGSLGSDDTATLTIWLHAPATGGTFTMTATVDPTNAIAERNETNNTDTASVTVDPSLPPYVTDLAVTGLTASPNPVAGNSTVTFTVTVSQVSGLAAGGVTVSLRTVPVLTTPVFVSGGNADGWNCFTSGQGYFDVDCGKGSSYLDGSIPAGGTLTLTITARTTGPATLNLQASATVDWRCGPPDNNPTNNTRAMTLVVQ